MRGGQLYAGDFVGAVDLGQTRIEVLPKSFGTESIIAGRRFLMDMLEWAGADARVGWLSGGSATANHDLIEVVERHLVRELVDRLYQGPPRRYQPLEEMSPVVRGRIQFSRYAHQLPSNGHLIPIQHNPLSTANELSCMLKALARHLWRRTRSFTVRRDLDSCLEFLQLIPDRELTVALVESVRLGRFEQEWHRIVECAALIVRGASPDPTQLEVGHQPTLLFSLNRLFELVIRRVLAKRLGPPLTCDLVGTSLKLLSGPGNEELLSIRPDLLIRCGRAVAAVGDAKWKVLLAREARYGVSPADVYQLLTYMRRTGSRTGFLFYPRAPWMSGTWNTGFPVEPSTGERISIVGVDVGALVHKDHRINGSAQDALITLVTELLQPSPHAKS